MPPKLPFRPLYGESSDSRMMDREGGNADFSREEISHHAPPRRPMSDHLPIDNELSEEHPLHGVNPDFGMPAEDEGPTMPDLSTLRGSPNPEDHKMPQQMGNRKALHRLASEMGPEGQLPKAPMSVREALMASQGNPHLN